MSSSEPSNSPAPTRKKRPAAVESSESSDDHDTSDASSADEHSEDSDAPQPLPSVTEQPTVLSHAERRRQKKRQKQNQLAATSSESSPRKRRKLDDAKVPAADDPRRQKRQHSVWVGNLSFRTTQDALRGFFDGVGTITRVHMPLRHGKETQGENMGCVLSPLLPPSISHAWGWGILYTYCYGWYLCDHVRPGSRISTLKRQTQK